MNEKNISAEMNKLNEKLDAVMGKMVGSMIGEMNLSDMDVDPMMTTGLETYKIVFEYMKLFTLYLEKTEDLMAKMDKCMDIYIQKEGA